MHGLRISPPRKVAGRQFRFNRYDVMKLAWYRRNPVAFVMHELGEMPSSDQAALLMSCADINNKYFILSAGRGAGKTIVVSWIVAWSMACYPDTFGKYDITILGGSYDQSRIMYRYFHDYIYRTKYLEGRLLGDPTKGETNFEGGYVRALTASEKAVRGPHPELLILDEVCAADDDIIRSALPMISGSRHGRIIMLSTPHQFYGLFQDYWSNHKAYEYLRFGPWPLTNCSWISQKWVDLMRLQFTPQKFDVEILGKPAEGGAMVFHNDWIDDCITKKPFGLNPNYGHDGGVDWGHNNPSVLVPAQKYGGKIWWPGPEHVWQYELFPSIQDDIKEIYHDNRGDTYYADNSHIGENQRMEANGINTVPIPWTERNKPELAELCAHLIYKRLIRISPDNIDLIRQLKKYRWIETASGKEKLIKKDVDSVEAALLSLYELYEAGYMDDIEASAEKFVLV